VTTRLAAALAGRYTIERELGQGGMATVYLAEDVRHHRKVALKVVREEISAGLGAERFLREIRLAASLHHPHILPLYDSGEADGCLYYVMPVAEGESLRDRLAREQRLPVAAAVQLAREVADALDYAHRHGVVHRDIKPENILLHEGHALITDFGIGKALSTASPGAALTQIGLAVGTPAYMSPEQAGGEPNLDGRSDLYSLGCVLYEMLAGTPPFTGPTVQSVIAKRFTEPPPDATASNPSVPAAVAAVARKLMATEPAGRFATGAHAATALASSTTPGGTLIVERAVKAEPERSRLVVLPFVNQSPDPENEYFSDGLTEEIITDLSRVKALSVLSRTSSMQLKGTTKPVRTLASELKVRYALAGSVRRAGSSLRITAELVDAVSDTPLWAEKFSGTVEDVFDVQERVAREIVTALGVTLSAEEDRRLASRPIQNVRAFELYLQARQELRGMGGEAIERGKALLARAVELEGKTAPLLYLLAWADVVRVKSGLAGPAVLADCASQADALLSMAPDQYYGHALNGYVAFELGKLADSVRHFRAALAREPNDPESLFWCTVCYWNAGHQEGAEVLAKRMLASDPLSALSWLAAGVTEWFAGRLPNGIAPLRRSLELNPEAYIARWSLGYNFALVGELSSAEEEARWLRAHGPQVPYTWQLESLVAALQGNQARAREILAPVDTTPLDFHLVFHFSESFAMAGDTTRALASLDEAVDKGFYAHGFMTRHCPFLVPLQGRPEFDRLMEKAGRRAEEFSRAVAASSAS
jgi:serine/threonine protein kinase